MDQAVAKLSPLPLMWDRPRARHDYRREPTKKVGFFMSLYLMMGFTVLSSAVIPALRYARGEGTVPPGDADPGSTVANSFLLLVVILYFLRKPQVLRQAIRPLALYWVVIALCVVSTLWSDYPFLTFKRCITLTNCVLFGIIAMEEAGLYGIIRLYGRTIVVLLVMSLAAYVAMPTIGKEVALNYTDGMRGIFSQKNQLGSSAVLGLACQCYLVLSARRWFIPLVSIPLTFGCLVLSMSATSVIIALLIMGLTAIVFMRRLGVLPLAIFGTVAIIAVGVLLVLFEPALLAKALGRDASLTGRVPLWQLAMKFVFERPWTGYGYSGFWNENSRNVQYIWQAIAWEAPSAHNGYIDVLLQIGIPGLAIYVAMWLGIIYYAAKAAESGSAPEAVWILLFMVVAILLNTDEGPLPYPDQYTAMMPAILIYIWRWRVANQRAKPVSYPMRAEPPLPKAAMATLRPPGPFGGPVRGYRLRQ